jgi:hypothetical protein
VEQDKHQDTIKAIAGAIKLAADDSDFVELQWKRGAKVMMAHAWQTFSAMAMKNLLVFFAGSFFVWAIIWAVKNEVIK